MGARRRNNMTKATAIVGVTCFLVLSATVYVALSDKDHSTTDISSPSATTDLHVDKVKDSDAGILGAVSREMVGLGKHTAGSGQCNKPQLSKIDRSIKAAAPKIQYAIDNKYDTSRVCDQPTLCYRMSSHCGTLQERRALDQVVRATNIREPRLQGRRPFERR